MKTVITEFGQRYSITFKSAATGRPVAIEMGEDCGAAVAKVVNDQGQVERSEIFPPTTTHDDVLRYYLFDLAIITR